MADDLAEQIKTKYPKRDIWIEVSEDGENGCFQTYKNWEGIMENFNPHFEMKYMPMWISQKGYVILVSCC